MIGDLEIRGRPLRLAFFIKPKAAQLLKTIEINSTLWGGSLNPIIPLYSQPPPEWRMYDGQRSPVRARELGYIRAFDPDIIINGTGTDLPQHVLDTKRNIIDIDSIWGNFPDEHRNGLPDYGVGIFEILNGIYNDLFETVHRNPPSIMIPKPSGNHELFWAAALGRLPESIHANIITNYADFIDAKDFSPAADNMADIFNVNTLFPRRISQYKIDTSSIAFRRRNDAYAFYMDADNLSDVIDFWNLRALGRAVLPIPKQFEDNPALITLVRDYIKQSFRVSRHNPQITFGVTAVRSYHTKMEDLISFADKIDIGSIFPERPDSRALTLQHWFPRTWDEWAMGKDGAQPNEVEFEKKSIYISDLDNDVRFEILRPQFASDQPSNTPRYANDIQSTLYGSREGLLATALPYDHGKEVLRLMAGLSFDGNTRVSRSGISYLVRYGSYRNWKAPRAADLVFAWLRDKGFDAKLSPCGRLASQIYEQLGSLLPIITNEPLLKLLNSMTEGKEREKGKPLGDVKSRLKKIFAFGNIYEDLAKRGIFTLGYKTQCPHCEREAWHGLYEFSTTFVCPLCQKQFDPILAVDSKHSGNWHLKISGPFSVGNFAEGSYSTLLAMNFLMRQSALQISPVTSFTATHRDSKKIIEADLAAIWQSSAFGEMRSGSLFAECKSYNHFSRIDFARMRYIAREFPGAILAFCTFRKHLSKSEIKSIRSLTKYGMRSWRFDAPINPVMILTGNELFSNDSIRATWQEMHPAWADCANDIHDICEATQGIYLGTSRWSDARHLARERKKKKSGKIN